MISFHNCALDRSPGTIVVANPSAVAFLFPLPPIQLIDESLSSTTWASDIKDPALKGLTTSSSTIGAFLGSIAVFMVADKIGRRRELQIGSLSYFLGAVGMYLSGIPSFSPAVGITLLNVARLVYGIGIGFSMHGAPTYIAEMAPPSLRGLLVSLKEAFIVIGILLGYLFGYILEDTSGGWRYMYGLSSPVALLMLTGTFAIPRSARWLILSDRDEEAKASLDFVFEDDTSLLFDEIKKQVDDEVSATTLALASGDNSSKSIFAPKWRGPLVAGVGLVVLQQVTGQPSILSYTQPIFKDAGLESYSSVLVGAFKLIATMFAVLYVENFGRRKLLFIGNSLMLVALLTLTATFLFDDVPPILTLTAMFIYIGGYQVGFGPIAWLMISECFPLSIRGQAVAFAVQMNFLWNSIVQFSVPSLQSSIGNFPMFAIFSGLCVYSIYFVHAYVPETRGLTLEQVEKMFESRRKGNTPTSTPLLSDVV